MSVSYSGVLSSGLTRSSLQTNKDKQVRCWFVKLTRGPCLARLLAFPWVRLSHILKPHLPLERMFSITSSQLSSPVKSLQEIKS